METLSLSARASLLKPSPTLGITARANAMKAEGKGIISFAAGEPDFGTPEPICNAAIEALNKGFTHYTPTSGIKELKDAICAKLQRENSVKATAENIIISCGAKQSVYNSMMTLLDPGDEVLLIAPYWMTYAEQVRLAGGTPVTVQTRAENEFIPTYDDIRAKITAKTKAIVLNSPCNPTGAVYSRDTIKEIGMLALRHGFWIISDEIYERLVYDGASATSPASLSAEVAERTITIGGVSKTFAMTGWRIGFAAAPVPVAKAMSNLQDQVTSNPTSFAQKGAVKAYTMDSTEVEAMRVEFDARRHLMRDELAKIRGLNTPKTSGAFYVLPQVSSFLNGKIQNDMQLAEFLLEEAGVATIPGTVFEAPGHLRLSYACSREDVVRGVERIADALKRLA